MGKTEWDEDTKPGSDAYHNAGLAQGTLQPKRTSRVMLATDELLKLIHLEGYLMGFGQSSADFNGETMEDSTVTRRLLEIEHERQWARRNK